MTHRPLELTNDDGLPVRCDVRLPDEEGPHPVVVVLHGFKGFKDWGMFPPTCERFAEAGIATVALNASMNGIGDQPDVFTELERFALNTPRREVKDVELVLDAIDSGAAGDDLDGRRIGLLGHSRGGGIVVLVTSEDPRVKALVTWAGISSFDRYTDRAKAQWRETGRIDIPNARTGQVMWLEGTVLEDLEASGDEYDLEGAAGRVRVPFLAVHGELDEAVDAGEAGKLMQWAAAADKGVVMIPKTGHTFGAKHPWDGPTEAWEKAVEETADWFERYL